MEKAYWVKSNIESTAEMDITNVFFAAPPTLENGHIRTESDRIVLDNVTLFPGQLTRWGAVKWGLLGVLRLGRWRVNRIKRYASFGKFRGDEGR